MTSDQATTSEPLTVLLLDDEDYLREMVQEALEEADFHVLSAASGEAGIALLHKDKAGVAALLTDIDLGRQRLSGWEVAREARRLQPDLPIIYMTGASGNEWQQEGVAGSLLMAKPFTLSKLIATLLHILQGPTPRRS